MPEYCAGASSMSLTLCVSSQFRAIMAAFSFLGAAFVYRFHDLNKPLGDLWRVYADAKTVRGQAD